MLKQKNASYIWGVITPPNVIDNVDIFNLASFISFGQKQPSSEGFFYQVRKLPLQCHKYTIRDYISCLVQIFKLF
jgi:hypothetical protein